MQTPAAAPAAPGKFTIDTRAIVQKISNQSVVQTAAVPAGLAD